MTDTPAKGTKRDGGKAADLAARLGALPQAKPATAAPTPADPGRQPSAASPRATRPARGVTGTRGKGRAGPPAEQDKPAAFYSERLSITTTAAQIQALRAARLADGIQATARLRAMIALWQDDPKIQARVDKLAGDWQ